MIARRTFATGALALAAAPLAARAQVPGKTYRVASWDRARAPSEITEAAGRVTYRAFYQELRRLGFVEGRNLVVERYGDEGRVDRHETTAKQIVETRPDVIVTYGPVALRILLGFTTSIPIVFPAMDDPLALGLVTSIARPGGNFTGFALDAGFEVFGLRLQCLKETAPMARRLGYLISRVHLAEWNAGSKQLNEETFRTFAVKLGVELVVQAMDGPYDEAAYRQAFADFVRRDVGGIYIGPSAEFLVNSKLVSRIANDTGLPTIYDFRNFADDGGLISYGVNLEDNYRKAAGYVARILNGEKPADLPIQQPTKFDIVVNLKTARSLGIALPESILLRAAEFIE
jgi:putative ABC transport system substrate-binding protein